MAKLCNYREHYHIFIYINVVGGLTKYELLYWRLPGGYMATPGEIIFSRTPIVSVFPSVRVVLGVTFIPGFTLLDLWF